MLQGREERIIERARNTLSRYKGSKPVEPGFFSTNSFTNAAVLNLIQKKAATWKDDCAVWRANDIEFITTTDMLVEGTHFLIHAANENDKTGFKCRLDSIYNAGWKSLAVNVSDIAADGGEPIGYLVSLGFPPGAHQSEIDAFTKGLAASSKEHRIANWGGDLVKSDKWVVCITAIGLSPAGKAISRSGAKDGEYIVVSGAIGLANIALEVKITGYNRNLDFTNPELKFIHAFARLNRPSARIEFGVRLREYGIASSMIDTSDSLAKSIRLLTLENGLGAKIDLTKLHLHSDLKKYLEILGFKQGRTLHLKDDDNPAAYQMILDSAEDYELLFTMPSRMLPLLKEVVRDNPQLPTFSVIGQVIDTTELKYRYAEKWLPIIENGFEHFKE